MNSIIKTNERTAWLDIARTVAIIAVVMCHSVEQYFYMAMPGWEIHDLSTQIFRVVFFTFGRLGVPIFLFLSGLLLLPQSPDNDLDVFKFYKSKLLPLFITTELWVCIYFIYTSAFNGSFDIPALIKQVFFIQMNPSFGHMWYMPIILGFYVAIPFISKIIHSFSPKALLIPALTVFAALVIIPNLNIVLGISGEKGAIKSLLDTSFLGGAYGLYLIGGFFLGKGILRKIPTYVLIIINLISFIFTCWVQVYAFENNYQYNVWYDFIGLFITSFCLFEITYRIRRVGDNRIVKKAAKEISICSLGIFFVHRPIQMLIMNSFGYIDITSKVILLFFTSLIISFIIVKLLSLIPAVGKWLFLIKSKKYKNMKITL